MTKNSREYTLRINMGEQYVHSKEDPTSSKILISLKAMLKTIQGGNQEGLAKVGKMTIQINEDNFGCKDMLSGISVTLEISNAEAEMACTEAYKIPVAVMATLALTIGGDDTLKSGKKRSYKGGSY